ncbi:MAG: S-layer homology domain-containing protein, partial [Candidatus Margulisiibacteriota bacterium]
VPNDHYAASAVRNMVKLGLFTVPASGNFNGDTQINRLTFYSYSAAFLELLEGASLPSALPADGFTDVAADDPHFPFMQKLVGAGILSGKKRLEGTRPVSRYEMAVFASQLLGYYSPSGEKVVKTEVSLEGYTDIPADSYVYQAVTELVEAGIIEPGRGRRFHGDALIDRYTLISLISRIVERIIIGETGELALASSAQAYKDVPVGSPAYPAIQKLITAGVIPPGNNHELFYGDRRISRYQMAFFAFSAVETVLSDIMVFKTAPAAMVYKDVPRSHYVFETIQKLIWLGALEGGQEKDFNGDEEIDRDELCYFTVNLVKAVFAKLKEAEAAVPPAAPEYGFNAYLSTGVNANQYLTNEAFGTGTTDLSATQQVSLYLNRKLNHILSVFASLTGSFSFGDVMPTYPYLDRAYMLADFSPLLLQAGRANYYQGFTPFGNSLFLDTTSADYMLAVYSLPLLTGRSLIGKLVNLNNVKLDSKFGSASLAARLPGWWSWLELSAGGTLITNLPAPDFTRTLNSNLTQAYGGLKANLFGFLELSIENANVLYSNPAVREQIGTASAEGLSACQYALTYYKEDFDFSLSVGYQKVGENYYLAGLASPATAFLDIGRGTESYLLRTVYTLPPERVFGADMAYVIKDAANTKNIINGYCKWLLAAATYGNLAVTKVSDNTVAKQDSWLASGSVNVTF